jgi:formylglycine-generating enzyme required for sulfatase activity
MWWNLFMRLPSVAALLMGLAVSAAEPPASPSWPLWDGSESVEQYAKRAKLEPTKTLDLGNGVKLEMVLIPAGKFVMGTPKPEAVDEAGFRQRIIVGQAALAVGGGVLLILLGVVAIRAIRKRQRPQFSLASLIVMVLVAGVGVLGGTHWWHSARLLAEAKAECQGALARFKNSYDWEKPAHEVTLTKPFYIGKFEVTQEQYQQVTGTNPSHFKGRDLPVEMVDWDDAQKFCRKAGEKTRLTVRLPTEAEWEHACRAGTRTTYYMGHSDADLDLAAWHEKNSGETTHPVGQKTPNAWGLHDMHGNVWEWVQDFYGPYKAEAATDPDGSAQGKYRVLRGGSWVDLPWSCRSSNRLRFYPDMRAQNIGFRVAADVPSKTP